MEMGMEMVCVNGPLGSNIQVWYRINRLHRHDSIQGTDYIVNYFFLNLRVSRAKIENLKWQFGGDIIPLTFRKFVTLLVQKLKILGKKLTCSQYLDWQFLLSPNILSFWIYDVTNFPKINRIISPPIRHFRFSISVIETFELGRQCSQYLKLNPTCGLATSHQQNRTPIRPTYVTFPITLLCTTRQGNTSIC